MKARDGFILRNIAGEYVLMPTGDNIKTFRGTVLMNELSVFLWNQLQTAASFEELLARVLDQYEIDEQTAAADLDRLTKDMIGMGILEP